MKKSTAAIVTILTLSAAIGLSACSSSGPVQSSSGISDKETRVVKAEGEGVVGSASASATNEESVSVKEAKSALDGFYLSIADREKAKDYVAFLNALNEDESLTPAERTAKGKEFFAEDLKRFDLEKVAEDDAFRVLSVATLASVLVDEDQNKITVPVEAISVSGETAIVDLSKVGEEDGSESGASGATVQLVKKDGAWLISAFPGTK